MRPQARGFVPRFGAFRVVVRAAIVGLLAVMALASVADAASPGAANPGAIWTSTSTGGTVNANIYDSKSDVYLNGGPQNCQGGARLPDGDYYFQVTDPSGHTLLSSDAIKHRQVKVVDGVIAGVSGSGDHGEGAGTCDGARSVQLMPFADTPNNGGEYSVDLASVTATQSCSGFDVDSATFNLLPCTNSKNDNFKVKLAPPGSLVVTKTLAGDLTGFSGGTFTFSVTCDDGVSRPNVSVDLSAGTKSAPAIDGIAAGTTCVVSEVGTPPAGDGSWTIAYEPAGGTVRIASGETAIVTVTNTRSTTPAAPVVTLSKSNDATGPVAPGADVKYAVTVHVTNGPATNQTIVDTLPTGISAVGGSISDGGTYDAGTNRITWVLPSVSDGTTLHYTGHVSASATAGTYTNIVRLSGCEGTGCQASSSVVVQVPSPPCTNCNPPVPQVGSLTITKVLNPADAFPGGTFAFDLSCGPRQSIALAPGQARGSVTLGGLAAGTPCVVAEVTPLTSPGDGRQWAGPPIYSPSTANTVGVTIAAGANQTVEITNFRGAVAGATATGGVTPPPTDSSNGRPNDRWMSIALVVLGLAGIAAAIGFATPIAAHGRRRSGGG